MQTSQELPIQQPEIRFTDTNITQSMPLVSTWHDSVVTLVPYIVEWKTLMLVCWFSNICLKLLEFLYRGFGQADKTLFFHDIIYCHAKLPYTQNGKTLKHIHSATMACLAG